MMNQDEKASDVPHIQINLGHYKNLYGTIMGDEFSYTNYNDFKYLATNVGRNVLSIIKDDPALVSTPLTAREDRAIHVAADAGSTKFLEELLKITTPEEQLIPNSEGMLPVHLAALSAHHTTVQHLCSQQLLDKMDYNDIQKLFFMTINNMFDVATKLFQQHPTELAIARDEENLTSLHVLARKPSEILLDENDTEGSTQTGLALFKLLWDKVVSLLKNEKLMEFINEPSAVLLDAIKSGNFKATSWLLSQNLKLFTIIKDPNNGRNLLHLLVQYRDIDSSIYCIHGIKEHLLRAVDNEGNNVLHLAAHLPLQFRLFSGLRASKQMLSEVNWFKLVERSVPRELRRMRNKKGKRAVDVFYDEHKQLSDEIKGAAKVMAKSGMLVATLVATVAFAAALTVPGDKNNHWFIVFILTNTVALFTSSASILSFLSNFTSSRFSEGEFITLHPGLTFGPPLLIISVVAMVLAFTAASFLIFDCRTKWVSYVVASMEIFPLFFYLLFQLDILDFIWLKRYYLSKI